MQWTLYTAAAPYGPGPSGTDVRPLVAGEARAAPRAQLALWGGVAVFAATFVNSVLTGHDAIRDLRRTDSTQFDFGQSSSPATVAIGAAQLVVGILFVIWFYRAARAARGIGLPGARSPIWAVLGFLVPVVNFWFPYQVGRDLFPDGHAARTTIKRWWALYLVLSVASWPVMVVAYYSMIAAVVVAVGLTAAAVFAARLGQQIIAASVSTHERMSGHNRV